MNKITLNGTWNLAEENGQELCTLQVPGTVLSGLLDAKLIEDPFYRLNEDPTRALFWKDYVFTREFDVSKETLGEDQIVLVCEGLDTLATIEINGKEAAKTDNMHRTWRIPVKEYLHAGKNTIRIVFASVLRYIEEYQYTPEKEIHYVPCGAMKGNQLIRKAHSMFGWDWGSQTIDAGIFRDIYLESYSHPRLSDVRIRQQHGEDVTVSVEAAVTGNVSGHYQIRCSIREAQENAAVIDSVEAGLTPYQKAAPDAADDYQSKLELTVTDPKLWWPNGYGSQPLYLVTTELFDEQGTVVETVTKRIGLRTLTVSTEKDAWGNEFAFCVNGVKIFAMGGNYIPEDCLYTRIRKKDQEFLLDSCVQAHFNCVRVWGGGYYPSDAFYDMCDEKGLIVWQDLMYACNVYDVTDAFAENCRQETVDNVRRLRHHASLGLWCGNNEIESAWYHWPDFQTESPYLRADYIKLFEDVLPKAVRANDDQTFYWHSSPSSGGCFDFPDDDTRGDKHYWDVWHGQKPFTDYRKYFFRFCSEFGFQSFPCMKTVESFTEPADRNIFSRVMENHQKNDSANGKMLYYLSENFRYPESFEKLLYITQVLQGMAIKYGVDHWRRNRGRCMGTLYWQVNDDWPVASWSSIDYYGRWKALHYMAKKFYAPQAVSIVMDDTQAEVWLENESMEEKAYTVTFYVKNTKGAVLKEVTVSGSGSALGATKVLTESVGEFLPEKYHVFVEAVLRMDGEIVQNDVETLVPYKYLEMEKADVAVTVEEYPEYFAIRLTGNGFVPFVALDFADADVIFEDNFFHLTDNSEKVIRLYKKNIRSGALTDADAVKEQLVITTLN